MLETVENLWDIGKEQMLGHPHRAAILDDRAAISDEWLAKEAHRAANSNDLFRSRLQKVVTARKMAPFSQPPRNLQNSMRQSVFPCFGELFTCI